MYVVTWSPAPLSAISAALARLNVPPCLPAAATHLVSPAVFSHGPGASTGDPSLVDPSTKRGNADLESAIGSQSGPSSTALAMTVRSRIRAGMVGQ